MSSKRRAVANCRRLFIQRELAMPSVVGLTNARGTSAFCKSAGVTQASPTLRHNAMWLLDASTRIVRACNTFIQASNITCTWSHIDGRVLWNGLHKILRVNNARPIDISRSFINANERPSRRPCNPAAR